MATHSSSPAWEILWTEEPSSPRGCRELDMTEGLSMHVYNIQRIIHKGTHQSI